MATHLRGPGLMTSGEVARTYNVRVTTVGRWRLSGKLHPVKLPSGHYRYFRAEIAAWMNGKPLTERQLEKLRRQLVKEMTS